MKDEKLKAVGLDTHQETEDSQYEPPKIKTYTSEEIIEQIGPAMACSPSPCPTGP